jgi:hypothetical protein
MKGFQNMNAKAANNPTASQRRAQQAKLKNVTLFKKKLDVHLKRFVVSTKPSMMIVSVIEMKGNTDRAMGFHPYPPGPPGLVVKTETLENVQPS